MLLIRSFGSSNPRLFGPILTIHVYDEEK